MCNFLKQSCRLRIQRYCITDSNIGMRPFQNFSAFYETCFNTLSYEYNLADHCLVLKFFLKYCGIDISQHQTSNLKSKLYM